MGTMQMNELENVCLGFLFMGNVLSWGFFYGKCLVLGFFLHVYECQLFLIEM